MAAITDLDTAGSAGDGDYLAVSQGGTDRKMTRTMLGLTGAGKVATGGFTLTVPATGTAASGRNDRHIASTQPSVRSGNGAAKPDDYRA